MKKTILFISFLLISFSGFSQFQITVQPVRVGVGQYSVNAININPRPYLLTDTVVTLECYLINLNADGSSNAIPENVGKIIKDVKWRMNVTKTQFLILARDSVLNTVSPPFVIR
jgi:hypothetical protein